MVNILFATITMIVSIVGFNIALVKDLEYVGSVLEEINFLEDEFNANSLQNQQEV